MVTNFGQNKYTLCPLPSFKLFPYIVSTGTVISELIFPSLNGFGSLISLPHIFSYIVVYEYKREEEGGEWEWCAVGHGWAQAWLKESAGNGGFTLPCKTRASFSCISRQARRHTHIDSLPHTHTHAGNTCKHLGMSTKYVY